MPRWLIIVGLAIAAIGVLLHFAPGLLSWFGKLPGDIHIEKGNSRIFIPVTSMLLVSIVLSLVVSVLNR